MCGKIKYSNTKREALLRLVVEAKYESMCGGWSYDAMYGSYNLGVWTNIGRGWGNFSRFVRYEVRDGHKIQFWHDI